MAKATRRDVGEIEGTWMDVECETAEGFRWLRRLCATAPKTMGASISAQPSELRFFVTDRAAFKQALDAAGGRIV